MRIRKQGFTLIELLAVIVILAFLALVTTPIVLNTIEKAKKDSFIASAKNALHSANLYEAKEKLIPYEGMNIQTLDMKNKEGYQGTIFASDGTYVLKNFTNGEYCASGTANGLVVTKTDCSEYNLFPTVTIGLKEKTTQRITIRVSAEDNVGIEEYRYCIENCEEESSWHLGEEEYTFEQLTHSHEYKIQVKVKNKISRITEKSISVMTANLPSPTYQVTPSGWSTSKTVTITYPAGYQNYYQVTEGIVKENGVVVATHEEKPVAGTSVTLTFESNGRMVAKTSDGYNVVTVNDLVISQVDTAVPVVTSASIASTNANYHSVTTTITSNVTDDSGILEMYISNSGYETGGSWESYNANKSWNVGGTLNGGVRTVYITYRDPVGNKVNQTLSYTVYNECASGNTTTTYGAWGTCSKTCGGGTQTRSVTVKDNKTGKTCSTSTGSQACNQQSCNLPLMTNGNFNVGWSCVTKALRGNSSCDRNSGNYTVWASTGSDSSSPWIAVFTTSMVNLTNYRSMVVDVSVSGGSTGSNPNIRLYTTLPTNAVSLGGTKIGTLPIGIYDGRKTLTVDLSKYSGNYYIGFDSSGGGSSGVQITLYNVTLLP